ncbi:hypothetical protein XA68_17273 [Ophiocordyceps unilateralis]|uniref:LysM domain-containing protein n=1 Tax=Ophiocordyceps unilateralis TaxID=268505 RepID=A0A2A9PPJ9_OPHUN|nr:hypothetical protein XA68_17273 [Ophiocordyceps unilateralis]
MVRSIWCAAMTALMTSSVHGGHLGCWANFESGVEYYMSPEGACCSPEFAVIARDNKGTISDVYCGITRSPKSTAWLRELPLCNDLAKFAPICSGIRIAPEAFRRLAECPTKQETPNSETPPHPKSNGCYSGRVYVNAGRCCTTDYVVTDDRGPRCGDFPGSLGPDNRPSQSLVNVAKCSKAIDQSQCPQGVISSLNALFRVQKCLSCCPDGYTRDHKFDCKRHTTNLFTLRKYWKARKRDGCELPKKGPRCCPDYGEFRSPLGECTGRFEGGTATMAEVYSRRNEKDGCVDFLVGLDDENSREYEDGVV